jgi:type VI secretion system lysozyme-like protein
VETSQWPRIYSGARALLFERLVDFDPRMRREPQPFRTLTLPELRASVRREVERLLNTRCPYSAAELEGRDRTVLDYGMPDFSALSPQRAEDRQRLAEQITQAITAFEPRLRQVRVTVEPPTLPQRRLLAHIEAVLVVNAVTEPVAFPVVLTDEPRDEEEA